MQLLVNLPSLMCDMSEWLYRVVTKTGCVVVEKMMRLYRNIRHWSTETLPPVRAEAISQPELCYLMSLPVSRDCPHPETLSLLDLSHLRLRNHKHVNHLLLFTSSLSTRASMRDDLMCSVDPTVDRFVAAVHVYLDFAPRAETTKCAGEVETRCARFAAPSGSSSTRMHAVSGCW
jgi:hypothetical protein